MELLGPGHQQQRTTAAGGSAAHPSEQYKRPYHCADRFHMAEEIPSGCFRCAGGVRPDRRWRPPIGFTRILICVCLRLIRDRGPSVDSVQGPFHGASP
jgi:hypothetical protein